MSLGQSTRQSLGGNLRLRLTILFFLQFAVWGAYLTSMGNYLSTVGLGSDIGTFYSMQGVVTLVMPTLFGILADRFIPAQKLLGLSHLVSAAFMWLMGYTALTAGAGVEFGSLFPLYGIALAFYMPTLGLSISAAYTALQQGGEDKVAVFPKVRIFGTVGFIVSMWLVDLLGFQESPYQFFVSGTWGVVLGMYAFTLPNCPVNKGGSQQSWTERLGLDAFRLFRRKRMLIFFIFSMCLGVCLQITNGYASPFISAFGALDEYKGVFFVEHANLLISLSQIAETLCILLIPFFLKRYGIKTVMLIAMVAWALRFGFFGIGSPTWPGIVALTLSMIVYGVAFDFFNISGSLFVDSEVEPARRSSAQGLFMLMTNGFGAGIGTIVAQVIVNKRVFAEGLSAQQQIEGWHTSWLIFASYAVVIAVLFLLVFKGKKEAGEEA